MSDSLWKPAGLTVSLFEQKPVVCFRQRCRRQGRQPWGRLHGWVTFWSCAGSGLPLQPTRLPRSCGSGRRCSSWKCPGDTSLRLFSDNAKRRQGPLVREHCLVVMIKRTGTLF